MYISLTIILFSSVAIFVWLALCIGSHVASRTRSDAARDIPETLTTQDANPEYPSEQAFHGTYVKE